MKKKNIFARLMSLYKGYKKNAWITFAGTIVGSITNLIYPYVSKYAIEKVVYMGWKDTFPILLMIAAILISLLIGDIFATKSWQYWSSLLYADIVNDIREKMYRKLHRLSFSWYDDNHTGEIISILDDDCDNSSHLVSDIAPSLLQASIQLVGGIIVFFSISPIMMLCISPLLMLLMFLNIYIIPKMRSQMKRIRGITAEQMGLAQDALSGIRTTQGYCMEEYEICRFREYSSKLRELVKNKWKTIYLHTAVSSSITSIIYGSFIVIGTALAILGKVKLSDVVLFYMYFHIITNPIDTVRSVTKEIGKCFASFERVVEILDTEEEVQNSPSALEYSIDGDIEFDHVSFKYKNSNELITDMSFKINKGEHIAIVGESGSGKSTLAGLIPRYYNTDEGSIIINDMDINLIDLYTLRRSIGFVSQDPFLYNVSVMDNIRYARPSATKEEVIEAAKKARAHKFILKLPDGYESKVGERGVKLSGGQKQRIAIARLFLLNPPIMVFDEATSALDSVQEKKVQKALNELAKGKTCITIAHRLSTIMDADRIFVMEDGKIVESGDHNYLLANPFGVYRKLYITQFRSGLL